MREFFRMRYRLHSLNDRYQMNLFGRDLTSEIAVIAEIGVNHEGNVEKASELVRLAATTGADAVKFQTFTPARYASASDPARLQKVTGFALDEAAHRRLAKEAKAQGIEFFSTAVTEDVVPLLSELCTAIKIASGDLNFQPVIRAAARTGKPMVISTGLGTVDEIDQAVGWVEDEVGKENLSERLALLHCVSAYPAAIEEANVRSVPFLADRYRLTVGYSNHVLGTEACLAAVALGARVLEVHFTDQSTGREFRDHALSMEPAVLTNLITMARSLEKSLGSYGKERTPGELPNILAVRKGIVAARKLEPGTVLTRDDLMFARPATEFPADQITTIVGKTIACGLELGELITRENVGA